MGNRNGSCKTSTPPRLSDGGRGVVLSPVTDLKLRLKES